MPWKIVKVFFEHSQIVMLERFRKHQIFQWKVMGTIIYAAVDDQFGDAGKSVHHSFRDDVSIQAALMVASVSMGLAIRIETIDQGGPTRARFMASIATTYYCYQGWARERHGLSWRAS